MYAVYFHVAFSRSLSHPVIIPNSALPLNYIPRRSCLIKVTSLTSLFRISNSMLGLSLIYLGQMQEGMAELQDATNQKATEEHGVIDEAIRDRGEGYTVFSIVSLVMVHGLYHSVDQRRKPVGVLYRPSENKLKNAKTRDFLGKAVRYSIPSR